MPNHIANEIRGDEATIAKIRERMKSDRPDEEGFVSPFDFNKLVPMPKHEPGVFLAEGNLGMRNSIPNWYDWSRENWGTKWNAYSHTEHRNTPTTIYFETAWAMPQPILYALADAFPELSFTWRYADEDLGYNCGSFTVTKGVAAQDSEPADKFDFAAQVHWQKSGADLKAERAAEDAEYEAKYGPDNTVCS